MDHISAFGLVIRQARTALGLSVRALAREVGCSHVHLGDLERGRRPLVGEQYWPRLAKALGLQPAELQRAADRSRTIEFNPMLMPDKGARFAFQFARRASQLTDKQYAELFRVINEEEA